MKKLRRRAARVSETTSRVPSPVIAIPFGVINPSAAISNAGPIGPGLVLRDYGEVERLSQRIAEFYKTATPAQILDTAGAWQRVLGAWVERETLTQQFGVNPANPNEVSQVDMILNMSPAERVEYAERWRTEMAVGTNP